ncbi:hypothetical protein IQ64_37660 [Streptomyces stelliscabiei]|nr:hypothetical protein IQ64_37660 [Streptomyces stelliscabiei]
MEGVVGVLGFVEDALQAQAAGLVAVGAQGFGDRLDRHQAGWRAAGWRGQCPEVNASSRGGTAELGRPRMQAATAVDA